MSAPARKPARPDYGGIGEYRDVILLSVAAIVLTVLLIFTLTGGKGEKDPTDGTGEVTQGETKPEETAPPATGAPETNAPVTDPPAETEPPIEYAPAPESKVKTYPYAIVPIPEADPADPGHAVDVDMEKYFSDVILHETEKAGDDYLDGVIFLGDSRTYGFQAYNKWYHFLKDGENTKQVWTPKNHTITLYEVLERRNCWILYPDEGIELPLEECLRKKQPKVMVIALGINGIGYLTEEVFKTEYGKVIEAIRTESPDTKIILSAILPLTKTCVSDNNSNNYNICLGNIYIAQLAQMYGAKYLDVWSAFADGDGCLPEQYNGGDGLHLTGEAYVKLVDYIVTHEYK
ncbi:MAG: GDSL-type esterase/lipase family protein [Lachnospiraceae bacterium]|nr:GDSL-type esterase/lipase family protein [Lachnospiraceae bacterium]